MEFLFDDSPDRISYIEPDEKGFTLRTEFKGTQEVLDGNARLRAQSPKSFTEKRSDGREETFYLGARVPMEVVEQMCLKLGRWPTAKELLALADERDYSKLKARDARLT